MESFSVAANAFAVLGLVDVILKASAGLYDRISKIRNAPQSISHLLLELQHLAEVIASVHAFVKEFDTSPYVTEDNRDLTHLHAVLKDCQLFLLEFDNVVRAAAPITGEGLLKQLRKHTSWALSDQKTKSMCQELGRHKATLTLALSVIGRQNDIVLRKQIRYTRGDLARIERETTKIQADLSAAGSASLVQHQHTQAELRRNTVQIQQGFQSISQEFALAHQQQMAELSAVGQMMSNLNIALGQGLDDPIFRNIDNPDTVTLPLMHLNMALPQLCSKFPEGEVPDTIVDFAQRQLNELLASSHRQSSNAASRRYQSRSPLSPQLPTSPQGLVPTFTSSLTRSEAREVTSDRDIEFGLLSRVKSHALWCSVSYPVKGGKLWFSWIRKCRGKRLLGPGDLFCLVKLAFQLRPEFSSHGVSTEFAFHRVPGRPPRFTRSLRPYTVIPFTSPALKFVRSGSVSDLDRLFRSGEASPFDRDEDGDTLLYYAIRNLNVDAFRFLLGHGADPMDISSRQGCYIIRNVWDTAIRGSLFDGYLSQTSRFENARQITRTLLNKYPETDLDCLFEVILSFVGKYISKNWQECAHFLASSGYALAIGSISEDDLDIEDFLRLLYGVATYGGELDCIRAVVENGVDVHSLQNNQGAFGSLLSGVKGRSFSRSRVFINLQGDVIRVFRDPVELLKDGVDQLEINLDGVYEEDQLETDSDNLDMEEQSDSDSDDLGLKEQLEIDSELRNFMEILVYLLELGCDPNAPHESAHVSDLAAEDEITWWMWTTALAETGYELETQGEDSKSYRVVKSADSGPRLSIFDRRFLCTKRVKLYWD